MKPRWITEAEALVGEKEVKGKLANAKIVELYKEAGHASIKSDEVPWCAAFVGACLVRANKPSTGTLLARDYLKYGKSLGKKPEIYSIGIMQRGNSGWEGHVGFVVKFDANYVWLLGGNQADSVNVSKFPRGKFLGFVVPVETATDVPAKEINAVSRRLQTQTWGERSVAALGLGGAISWNTLSTVKQFAADNVGLIMLGGIAAVLAGSYLVKWMSHREYREGRYLPKRQWE
jgi:uncharacterized protein (TIGR02594 family)